MLLVDLSVAAEATSIADRRAQLHAVYRKHLVALADWCDEHQLPGQVAQTRTWLPDRDRHKSYVFVLPDALRPPIAEAAMTEDQRRWWEQFVRLRRIEAGELMKLANRAIEEGQVALAYELVNEAVRENPEHERGRAFLGYQKVGERWVRPQGAQRLAAGETWHPQYGWIAEKHIQRYENGQRFYRGNWITAEAEARLRQNLKNGWQIHGERFDVLTNQGLIEGAALLEKLERLDDAWQQLFADYYLTASEAKHWLAEGRPATRQSERFEVILFRDRAEFIEALAGHIATPDLVLGLYLDSTRQSYFFHDSNQYDGTVYHEATHQLFQQTRPVARDVGRRDNFWAIEAVACYLESLDIQEGYYTIGGFDQGRAPAALHRLLVDDFYVPLAELTAMGMEDLQRDQRLPMIYSQISGLALFFLHYDDGRYRAPFLQYLKLVYSGRANPNSLAKLTGVRYAELDRQYREFMQQGRGVLGETGKD